MANDYPQGVDMAAAIAAGFVLDRREAVEPVLQAMGVTCLRIERPEEVVATVAAACTMVFQGGRAVAVLLTQKLLGAKAF